MIGLVFFQSRTPESHEQINKGSDAESDQWQPDVPVFIEDSFEHFGEQGGLRLSASLRWTCLVRVGRQEGVRDS